MEGIALSGEHPRDFDYSHPVLECDIIMKGGVTSGVIYPWGICELAKTYRFKNVGGTSAGAVAAAAAAAAEYGRAGGGFRELAEMPEWLGEEAPGGSRLFALFGPDFKTRALYATLTAALGTSGLRRWVVQLAALVRFHLPFAVAGSLLGVWCVWLSWLVGGLVGALGLALGVVLALAGAVVGAAIGFVVQAVRVLPRHDFGLCRGFDRDDPEADQLTAWFDRVLRKAAGTGDEQLTFGMLWRGPDGSGTPDKPWLQLEMMTTDVTAGMPAKMPWQGREFFFDPDEMRGYFPNDVVQHMIDNPPSLDDLGPKERSLYELQRRQVLPKLPLPEAAELPVVVAARLSLSFPILICAVPLYAIDWGRSANQDAKRAASDWLKEHPEASGDELFEAMELRVGVTKHWFSDGGFCSNFPLHLFDAPLPSRPTFAINLRGFHPDNPNPRTEAEKVFLPTTNREGMRRWHYDVGEQGWKGFASFIGALGKTMQNWQDNSQVPLAGFRDRIVHLSLSGQEGGLNLKMDETKVRTLAQRGQLGAVALVKQFAGDEPGGRPTPGWENHRWIRYRVALVETKDWLSRYAVRFNAPSSAHTPGYREVTAADAPQDAHGSPWPEKPAAREAAAKASADLADFGSRWPEPTIKLGENAPKTRPRVRLAWSPGRAMPADDE